MAAIEKDLVLKRVSDGVVVITLQDEDQPTIKGRRHQPWNASVRSFVPVRYAKSGRKGYLKANILEADFKVIGRAAAGSRWDPNKLNQFPGGTVTSDAAAAMAELREHDVRLVCKRILNGVVVPGDEQSRSLGALNPSLNALSALEQAVHMILAGV